jgi:hypothetical protein
MDIIGDLHHDVGVSARLFLNAITADQGFSRHQFETTDFRLNHGADGLLYVDNNTIAEVRSLGSSCEAYREEMTIQVTLVCGTWGQRTKQATSSTGSDMNRRQRALVWS